MIFGGEFLKAFDVIINESGVQMVQRRKSSKNEERTEQNFEEGRAQEDELQEERKGEQRVKNESIEKVLQEKEP